MIVILKQGYRPENLEEVLSIAHEMGFQTHLSQGQEKTIVGIIGDDSYLSIDRFANLDFVEDVVKVLKPYKRVTRFFHPKPTVIPFPGFGSIGGGPFTVMAGPCAVESLEMLDEIGAFLKEEGVLFLRGGAFKPRTSPYSFSGLGKKGLEYLRQVADRYGFRVITEVMGLAELQMVMDYADILQVGARNAQNFRLLEALGNTQIPVFLKRGFMNTIQEFLQSAEYILANGNQQVILCERGIRTFETATRNTLDISAVPVIKESSHLPIFVDPSHASGKHEWVPSLAYAALATGADGIMVEVHPHPARALSDGRQSLNFPQFHDMNSRIQQLQPLFASERNPQP
ncbi:MAG TPA: 3-deoxy-7-phosphoheptulonate synthase [Thermotogota bacterium]|nr:3-deoxy-7-phosphoheptulonate synthase [Thermotogota bacterium]HRW93187.1 3-deoxy-7-phosphoheptulonate synthase [Thermotogota bacterium]